MEQTQETQGRQNRASRDVDARAKAYRPTSWRAPETLPSPDERPGWAHRWVRISILGTDDPKNISSKLREGYEPCKAEDYPELMLHAIQEGRFKGNIEVGGLLLCRIPKEFMEQRAEYFSEVNKAQTDSVDNNFLSDNDPRMRKFSEKSSKVSFGSGS
jgi:hypothetical protein